MNETLCHTPWRDQPTTTIWRGPQPDIVPTGEVRAARSLSFTWLTEPQTRLFWV
jgi:hypothetical protein